MTDHAVFLKFIRTQRRVATEYKRGEVSREGRDWLLAYCTRKSCELLNEWGITRH